MMIAASIFLILASAAHPVAPKHQVASDVVTTPSMTADRARTIVIQLQPPAVAQSAPDAPAVRMAPWSLDVADNIALVCATIVVTGVGIAVALATFFGYKGIQGTATNAARDALKEYLASDRHREMVRKEIAQLSRKLFEELPLLMQNQESQMQDSTSNLKDYPKPSSDPESEQ